MTEPVEHDLVLLPREPYMSALERASYFQDEDGHHHALDCRGCRLERVEAELAALKTGATPVVYKLQESTGERDGLQIGVDVCASLLAAQMQADVRAGRFADAAGDWVNGNPYRQSDPNHWTREVPGIGWQHIFAEPLIGAV